MSGFTVAVDLGNPGQLFACCGLLEAADRLWRGEADVTGHFDGNRFRVSAPRELDTLLGWLLQATVKDVEKRVRPVRKRVPCQSAKKKVRFFFTAPPNANPY